MKVILRRTRPDDLEGAYDLHTKCFNKNDQWYKSSIRDYLNNGFLIETSNKKVIGLLLEGNITPCNKSLSFNDDYKGDIFEPINDLGKEIMKRDLHYRNIYGIMLICIDPDYQGKGLAAKLIEKHFIDNPNKLLCLNTRRSNINAYKLYKKMGYQHVAFIKNKYFNPNEESIFMIKDN